MTQPHSARQAAISGARDLSPVILGVVPFGLIAGIAAVEAGLPAWSASVFSVLVFAGASQLAALELLGAGANTLVVVATIAIINTRSLMYSASLATRFADETMTRRAVMGYLLTDQSFAMTTIKLDGEPDYGPRWAYFMGGMVPMWLVWQAATVVGAVGGAVIPEEVPLGFTIPLVFAALLVPAVVDRATLAAAVSSGIVAVAAAGLPANLGLLVAALTGIAVGTVVSIAGTTATATPPATPGSDPVVPPADPGMDAPSVNRADSG